MKPDYKIKYKVFKVFRRSGRRVIIRRGLTLDEARHLVTSYPDSQKSMKFLRWIYRGKHSTVLLFL